MQSYAKREIKTRHSKYEKIKYFFKIEKQIPPVDVSNNDRFNVPPYQRKTRFSVEVDADDFIDLMQHLWDIAQRKINKG